jgi:hypothetical protein
MEAGRNNKPCLDCKSPTPMHHVDPFDLPPRERQERGECPSCGLRFGFVVELDMYGDHNRYPVREEESEATPVL